MVLLGLQIQYFVPEHYDRTNAHCKSLSETFPARSGWSCVALFWLLASCELGGWMEPTGVCLNLSMRHGLGCTCR